MRTRGHSASGAVLWLARFGPLMRLEDARALADDTVEVRYRNMPGVRTYYVVSQDGETRDASQGSRGAVVLYDTGRVWRETRHRADPEAVTMQAAAHDIERERDRKLPHGPMSAHFTQATRIAAALHDGACGAVIRLNAVFHLETGERDAPQYDKMKKALAVAHPSYEQTRDFLLYECECFPWIVCVLVAVHLTTHDERSPFYVPYRRRVF